MNSIVNNSNAVNGSSHSFSFSRCGGCTKSLNNCICYDDLKAEKIKSEDQYKVKKPIINVIVTDSDNESDEEDEPLCEKCEWEPSNCKCGDNDYFIREIKALKTELEAKNNRVELLEIRLQEKQNYKHLIEKRNDYLNERVKILDNALDKKDDEIKKLDEENTKLLSENEEAKDHIEADKETIIELEGKVKELRKTLKESKNMHADAVNELDELKNNTCDYEYIHVLSKKNNELEDRIKNLKAVIDDLRTQKDENLEQIRQQKEDEDKVRIIRNNQAVKLHKIIEEKNKEIFYYESKVREMNEHTKLNNK
jgi:chromosome segregation ATPase